MKLIGRTGSVAGRDAMIGDSLRIGASADNDFRLEVTGISRHHARVVREGSDFWLEDSGSTNGTFVNGLRVARERLRHLDVVTLGRGVDLIAVVSEASPSQAIVHAVRAAWLEPLDPQFGSRIDIPPGELTLGRSAPSNVLLDSPMVSHLHARLERTPDHLVVSDLASSNGTFVNGTLIREPVELVDGDTLSIAGSRQFRVCIVGTVRRESAAIVDSARTPVDSEWKTRLVWSADELVELEADRQRILAAWRKEQAAAAAGAGKPAASGKKPAQPEAKPAQPAAKPATPPAAPPKPATPPHAKAAAPAPAAPPVKPVVPEKAVAPEKPVASEKPVAPEKAVAPIKPAEPSKPVVAAKPAPSPKHAEPPKPAEPIKPDEPAKPTKAPALTGAPIRQVQLTGSSGAFKLGLGRHDVGRSDSIAMTLLSPQVSRVHASIIVTTTEVRVEDAKSANGTVVNGTRLPIGGTSPLKSGDRVAFGNVEFTVEVS
jgi:pSer/pThr/pTyr-binding forkhead associated (FHA) protein